MKNKKISFLIKSFILLGTIILFNKRILKYFNRENVYIIFNVDEDLYKPYDWSKHKDIFPIGFNPKDSYVKIEELTKLNDQQKHIYDSIKTNDFHYPKKIIKSENNSNRYYISVSDLISVNLELEKEKNIDSNKIKSLNIISVDSMVELIPELFYKKSKFKDKEIKFHIIELNSKNTKIKCIDVNPIVIEYN